MKLIERIEIPGKYRMFLKAYNTIWEKTIIAKKYGYGIRIYFEDGSYDGASNFYGRAKYKKISDNNSLKATSLSWP